MKKNPILGHTFNKNLRESIQGDKSIRHSVFVRPKDHNIVDTNINKLSEIAYHLLKRTGVFNLRIGLNNGQIEASSVFDPFNTEVHHISDLIDEDYLSQNFTLLNSEDKCELIKTTYKMLSTDKSFNHLTAENQNSLRERNEKSLVEPDFASVKYICESIPLLRNIEHYHLRTISINVFNSVVSMTFNCDGTQIMSHDKFKGFIEDYILP